MPRYCRVVVYVVDSKFGSSGAQECFQKLDIGTTLYLWRYTKLRLISCHEIDLKALLGHGAELFRSMDAMHSNYVFMESTSDVALCSAIDLFRHHWVLEAKLHHCENKDLGAVSFWPLHLFVKA